MAKPKKNTADAAPSADAGILSLASIDALEQPQQVALYVATENVVRCGFLQQGKILHCLGDGAVELLRDAGIRPTTLANARNAQWVLETLTRLEPAVLIHAGGDEPVPFSEAVYDTLTLRKCEILRKAFSAMGTVKHRPLVTESRELVQRPNWDDEIECWFENGTDLAGMAAREREAQEALAAEQQRREDMERQIAELQQTIANSSPAVLAPAPAVTFNAPAPAPAPAPAASATDDDAETTGSEDEADAYPDVQDAAEETDPIEDGAASEVADPDAPPVSAIVEDTLDDEEEQAEPEEDHADNLSEAEVAAAFAAATADIATYDNWCEAFANFSALTEGVLAHADDNERDDMASSLEALLATLRPAPAAAPAAPTRASRGRRAALAA